MQAVVVKEEAKCPLCEIPKNEKLLYHDNLLYLVKTKEMKGHGIRVMVVTQRHTIEPTFTERTIAQNLLIWYMAQKLEGKPWFIVAPTYASIKDHWHLLGCTLWSDDPKEREQLSKTEKVVIPERFELT